MIDDQDDINSAITETDHSPQQGGAGPVGRAWWGAAAPALPAPDATVTFHGPVDSAGAPTVGPPYQPAPSGPPVYVPNGYPQAPQPPYQPPHQPPRQPPRLPPGQPPHQPPRLPPGQPPRQPPRKPLPARPHSRAWWLSHALLLSGVALLWVATYLPWAVSQSGALIMLQSIGVSAPSSSNGMTALQFADDVIGALLVCSLGLLFFNAILSGLHWLMGGGCFGGCAVSLFYPILLALVVALAAVIAIAAGFGGYGPLSQLPLVSSYGLGGLGAAHYELGYYTWYTGLIVNAAGMFGEFVVWRR